MNEAQMRDRIEYLEAEVANLRDELGLVQSDELVNAARRVFRIAPQQAKLLVALMDGRQRSHRSLIATLWGELHDEPDSNALHVHIAHLRRGLKPHGIKIGTIWAYGFQMSAEDCAKARAAIGIEARP